MSTSTARKLAAPAAQPKPRRLDVPARQRAKAKSPTKAQQAARSKIIAESGVTPSTEGMAAIVEELRH
jgi:hypothetical protein